MAARTYHNFDLSLEAAGDGSLRARVVDCPAGGFPPVPFSLPFEHRELENLMLKLDPGRSGSRRSGLDAQRQAGADLGGILFDAVFRDQVMLAWTRSRDVTRSAGEGLRLRLRLADAAQVAGLPWELLYDRRTNSYLAQSDRTPLVRYLEVPYPPRPLTVGGSLRILVVLSSPTDLADLDVEAEWRRVREAMSAKVDVGAVVVDRLPAPTMAELSAWLVHHDVHALHFIGHGDYDERIQSGVVYFCDEYGRSVPVGPDTLGPFLSDHDPLRLVLLNACRSARVDATDPFGGMAQGLIQQDVTAVVAMQFPISDGAAVAFTTAFYSAVADGIPVDQAATQARKALLISNPGEWATPVLFMRAPDGRIFDAIAPDASGPPEQPEKPGMVRPPPEQAAIDEDSSPSRPGPPSSGPTGTSSVPPTRTGRLTRHRALIAAAVALVIGGVVAALLIWPQLVGRPTKGEGSYTATAPWRLRVDATQVGDGCSVVLTDTGTGTVAEVASHVYGITKVQLQQVGSFHWQSTDRRCLITPLTGSGAATLPFTAEEAGDTDTFAATAQGISAQVKDFHGNSRCVLRLFDASNGQELDLATATPQTASVTLDPNGRTSVYLDDGNCVIRLSALP